MTPTFRRVFPLSPAVLSIALISAGFLHAAAAVAEETVFQVPARWQYSAPQISPEKREAEPSHAQKDPTVVFHGGRWHVFMTVKLPARSAIEYCSFDNWAAADRAPRTLLKLSDSNYFCAPQVFYFTPHKLWYLVYQVGVPGATKMQVAYSTTADLANPASWTPAAAMLDGGPNDPRREGGLDYWIICDQRRAYLFFTSLNGKLWRLWTPLENFPRGFDHCELALQAPIFEASHTYRLLGRDQYLTIIEENGRRFYKAYLADRLDGPWRPLADTAERPFAGWQNTRPAAGVQPWTDNISHGELLRLGVDESLTIDPDHPRFLFQGLRDEDKASRGYGQFPWRLGLLTPVADESSPSIHRGGLPPKVHVVENYETDIEQRWFLAGKPTTDNVPPSTSASLPNRRACRATETLNFDREMGDRSKPMKAVIFNPVPGPPMGPQTRLAFRYFLDGADAIQVQIYSLTNNYHRRLLLTDLPRRSWRTATVDMTVARQPDGGGGPLAEDERIDDIQFYIPADADLLIDDIVLYEAASVEESRPFPRSIAFTGWFDTGKQGAEWPGDFEIVPHDSPLTWDAARSVLNPTSGDPWLRIHLRGSRPLASRTTARFRYKLSDSRSLRVQLADGASGRVFEQAVERPQLGAWAEATVAFEIAAATSPPTADELRLMIDRGGQLLVDDVLVFEP